VKIGDTAADMEEGRNAGMWTIGVTLTGNEVGLVKAAADRLSSSELAARLSGAREKVLAAGGGVGAGVILGDGRGAWL